MKTTDLLKAIDPKNGAKFSPNLYKWVKKFANRFPDIKVYRDDLERYWIGEMTDDGFTGNRLFRAMIDGKKENFWWPKAQEELTEIKDFWKNYLNVGRCASDSGHNTYFASVPDRWKTIDKNNRECIWCGQKQKRIKKRVSRTEYYWI